MAAYASLVSLMDLINQIQHHPHPPLSLHQQQAQSLTDKIGFLQGFLEDFHSRGFSQEIHALESRIADVAHAAADVIESQILLMAAYEALVSLMHLIEQIKHHPAPSVSLDETLVCTVLWKVKFLQGFLEDFPSRGFSQDLQFFLQSQIAHVVHAAEKVRISITDFIADVAHAAQDVRESQILLMSAYEALVSLTHLIEQIKHHPAPSVSIHKNLVSIVLEKVRFLHIFLEVFPSGDISQEVQFLQSQIALVVHAAEKVRISVTDFIGNKSSSPDLYEGLQIVIQDMEFVEKEVLETKKKMSTSEDDDELKRRSLLFPPPPPHLGSSSTITTMVGFDKIMNKVMDRLTGNQRSRQIIPLVGMGGSGKTTLARNIYENKLIVEHFHMRLWATISQQCIVRDVLIEFLRSLSNHRSREELNQVSEECLGEQLYKSLCRRKYLIVLDDLWGIDAWDKLKFYFPEDNNRSRIVITSRLSKLASDLAGSHSNVFNVDLLDDGTSWDLLSEKVFVDKICPPELEEIGRLIARNCRGLPLSIVTIAGHLSKSIMTRKYWEHVAENLSSLINSEDGEHCLRILSLSYNHLPVHLKLCFLYIGLFPEDMKIKASHLIELWVAEGFLKPMSGETLEVVGKGYLKDLVERNLVSVHQWGVTGKIKYCVMHDLLRDLCQREAHKEKFFSITKFDGLQGKEINNTTRHVAIHKSTLNGDDHGQPHHGASDSTPFLRSCIIENEKYSKSISLRSVRLLRILAGVEILYLYFCIDDIVPLVNLRFLTFWSNDIEYISSLWSMRWNIQTLIIQDHSKDITFDIWKMPQLRHVRISSMYLSDPPSSSSVDGGRLIVLENLQTLTTVRNFKCSEEVVKKIPNIKKLSIVYLDWKTSLIDYCLNNLRCLEKLESLMIEVPFDRSLNRCLNNLRLPYSLKRLALVRIDLDSDMLSTVIGGSLPVLEVLKLDQCSFIGDNEWNPVEGQFSRLKYLQLFGCQNIKSWNADSTHFPCLKGLRILWIWSLEEFPRSIGDIPTLRLIQLYSVRDSVLISARQMLEEQEQEVGDVTLFIHVTARAEQEELAKSLACNNFMVEIEK